MTTSILEPNLIVNKFVANELVHNDAQHANSDNDILTNTTAIATKAVTTITDNIDTNRIKALLPKDIDDVYYIYDTVVKNDIKLYIQMLLITFVCSIIGYFHFSITYILMVTLCLVWSIYHQRYRTAIHHAVHLQSKCYDPSYINELFSGQHAINNNVNISVADSVDNANNATSIAEQQKNVFINGDKDDSYSWLSIGCKHNELPAWLTFPDLQKVDWLNDTLTRLWSTIKICVQDTALSSVQPILDANKPAFLTSISFAELDLGDRPPLVSGVRFLQPLDNPTNSIALDMEIRLANNPVVAMKAKAGPAAVTVELADLLVEANIRVVWKPLINQWPLFSALSVSFVKKPTIKFRVETGDVNIMAIPGLNDWIYEFTSITLASFAVWPRRIVVPILNLSNDVLKSLWSEAEPLGMVYIKIIGCTDLALSAGHIGKADPYAQITINERDLHKTQVISNSKNPIWNYECELLCYDTVSEEIYIDIRNNETSGSSRLGDVSIPIKALDIYNSKTELISLPLCNTPRQSGLIDIEIQFKPFKAETRHKVAKQLKQNNNYNNSSDNIDINDTTSPKQQAINLTQRTTQPSNAKSSIMGVTANKLLGREGQNKALCIITIHNIVINKSPANNDQTETTIEPRKRTLLRGMTDRMKLTHSDSNDNNNNNSKTVEAYVVLKYGNIAHKTHNGKSNPSNNTIQYEQQFEFQIPFNDNGTIHIECRRHRITTGNNDLLGDLNIDIHELFTDNESSNRISKEFTFKHTSHKSFPQATLFTSIVYKPL